MQQFSRVLSNYRVTFIGKKRNKNKNKQAKEVYFIGLLSSIPGFLDMGWWGYKVEMERLHSHRLSRGIVLNLRKIQLEALFETTPKTSKHTQELCWIDKKRKKTGGNSFMWVNNPFVACNMDFCVDVPLAWFPRTKMCRWNNGSKCGKKSMCRFIWVCLKYNYCTRGIWFVFSTNCCSNGSK